MFNSSNNYKNNLQMIITDYSQNEKASFVKLAVAKLTNKIKVIDFKPVNGRHVLKYQILNNPIKTLNETKNR